jgi:acyl-CoA reductase-like NAD-dependent aldehyde dehydrogenase
VASAVTLVRHPADISKEAAMTVTPLPAATLVLEQVVDGTAMGGDGKLLEIPNPATGQLLGELRAASLDQIELGIDAARRAFDEGPWPHLPPAERADHIEALGDALVRHRDEMIWTLVSEVGTPISIAGPLQFDVPLKVLRWMAEAARRDRTTQLGPDLAPPASMSMVAYRPVGVVAALAAYNFPLSIAVWKIVTAMAAGCTTVLMPSPRTPFTATLLGQAVREAGIPDGVVNIVVGDGPEAGRFLTSHPAVDKVSFTGSESVGISVMHQAADTLKRVTLELGGKSPTIVLPGTDLATIVEPIHHRYARNAGQSCAAPSRLLLPAEQVSEFIERSLALWPVLRMGDPWDPATVVGPLIRPEHRDRVTAMVDGARADGAEVIAGGRSHDLNGGWFYEATLVGPLDNRLRIAQEEIFGPVAVLIPYDGVDDAVRIANETRFGLAASIYGCDVGQCVDVAGRLRAGIVTINGGGAWRPDAPAGGFKHSGIGREFGEVGIAEFLEPQHIQIPFSTPPAVM